MEDNNVTRYPKVEKTFSREMLQEFKPSPNSTPDELRRICLGIMRLQLTFPWVPKKTYEYTVKSAKRPVTLSPDTVYAGIPYVNLGSGNLYRLLDFTIPRPACSIWTN